MALVDIAKDCRLQLKTIETKLKILTEEMEGAKGESLEEYRLRLKALRIIAREMRDIAILCEVYYKGARGHRRYRF